MLIYEDYPAFLHNIQRAKVKRSMELFAQEPVAMKERVRNYFSMCRHLPMTKRREKIVSSLFYEYNEIWFYGFGIEQRLREIISDLHQVLLDKCRYICVAKSKEA
ncbi:hypothetical protein LOAG_07403 [Loa loa]|uniref:Uncharacterized protein n=1 Tax=Loa loa TaxID=7209 RepID=A0A1S0TXC9_LOALO|nr:hypothetical protein LOAG_07403 [Loa loa]EFO21085.1 hypothetical protein LOAG_07403 [Loa loa]